MHCKGKTKAGIPCKNKAVLDGYCKLHHPGGAMRQDSLTKAYRDTMKHVDMMKGLQDSMKFLDPMKEYREAMKHVDMMKGFQDSVKFLDPMKEYREAMKHVDMMKSFQDSVKFLDPMKEYREAMKHVDTMEGLRDSMKFLDPMKEYREAMKHVDTMKDLRDSMEFLDPMKEYREAMKHVHSMKGLQESIKFILPSERFKDALGATNLWDQFGGLHQQIKTLKSTISAESISSLIKEVRAINTQVGITDFGTEPSINPDGTLTFALDSIELQSLHDVGSQVILHALQNQSANIVEAIERLIVEIRSVKDPLIQKILSQLIFPVVFALVFAFFNPVADFYVKNYLNKHEKKQISTQINESVISNVQSKEVLRNLRYVKADILCVRKNKSKSGQLIGHLNFGQVVEVLEKRKNWSLIKWEDETGQISIEGWVFTRYLKNFK
jgi:hypothetical protein